MLFLWTLLALFPCLANSVPVGDEFLLPRNSEKDISPFEDTPPTISNYRRLIPSTEHHNTRNFDEDIVGSEPSNHYLHEVAGKEESSNSRQTFTARRRNLNQAAFTVKPKSRMQIRPQQDVHDTSKPLGSFRRHKAFNSIHDEQEVELRLREKRGISSPAVDAVDENPAQWKRFDSTKPQFVTSRNQATRTRDYNSGVPQHRSSHAVDDNDIHNMKYNEIPVQQREPTRYTSAYGREPVAYRREEEPPRRIIYYANLPEVIRSRPLDDDVYRRERTGYGSRYDYGRSYNKHPRESRYEDNPIRSSGRDRSYSYRQPGAGGSSYAIIDAERSPPQKAWPPPQEYAYRDPDILSRYNRIPAPYQQPQGGGRYPNDQRHGLPQPPPPPPPSPSLPPPADYPNAALLPSRYNPYGRTGNFPRSQLTVTPAHSSVEDEPYRDYNPRQPAPWSLQIGTKLTVKDDGRQMPSPGGKRFYVQSQQEYPSRYLRSGEDLDSRQMGWQE